MTVTISGTTGVSLVQDLSVTSGKLADGAVTPVKTSGARQLLQSVNFTTGAVATGTTAIPMDDTIPQITEGDQYMSLVITPLSASSTLEISVFFNGYVSASSIQTLSLFRDSTADAIGASVLQTAAADSFQMSLPISVTSGSTTATTFKVRSGNHFASTTTFNGRASARALGGIMASSITIKEYAA